MAKLQRSRFRPSESREDYDQPAKPTLAEAVEAVAVKLSACGADPAMARELVHELCEQEKPRERPQLFSQSGGGMTYHWPYQVRLVNSAAEWARMTDEQEDILRAGVKEERIPWRGESFDMYMRTVKETLKMRHVGRDEYRKQVVAEMRTMGRRA